MKAENRIDLNIDNKGKGRRFECRFLQAGLVKYSFGVCLLNAEAINKFAYKFVGCPVIIDHKDITDENAKEERVGVISKVWFSEFDGWYWCEGVLFDDEAISLIKDKGYNVSCQYNIDDYLENTSGALHNGNPYDITILDGTPEHLAIVKNPRYEEALIAVNKGEDMKAENTEFRTGYDSEGDTYVYPLEGADKSEKKETKKEDKKDSGYKIPDDYKKSVKDYTKEQHEKAVDEYGEKMATVQKKSVAHPDNETYRAQFEEYKALKDYHEEQASKSDKKEDKKDDKLEDKKQPKQLKLFNALEEQLERFVSLVAKNFDESKHDRDKDGKFTDSGNFSGESVDEQEAKLVKELKRLEKNGQDVSEIYKKLTGKEWGKKEAKKESKKENKPGKKSQKSDSVKFDKIGKVLTSVLKDAEKSYKESK